MTKYYLVQETPTDWDVLFVKGKRLYSLRGYAKTPEEALRYFEDEFYSSEYNLNNFDDYLDDRRSSNEYTPTILEFHSKESLLNLRETHPEIFL